MSGINRPLNYGPKNRREFIVENSEVTMRMQNDGNGNPIYIGRAKVGTLTSDDRWQISFHTYDGNDALLTRVWAENTDSNASSEYEFIWDDRVALVYS